MKLNDFCVAMAASIAITASGATYRIAAPNGVGDVTALTNAVAQIDAAATSGTRLLLEPGVYNLAGTSTGAGGAHIRFDKAHTDLVIAGLGATPGDTILLGGGAADKKRILHVWNTSAKVSATISNLTVTGAYTTTDAAGIYGSQYLVLRDLVISNNVANGLGAGCLRGKAYNCLFANNTATGKNGGGFWSEDAGNGAWNCTFIGNAAPAGKEGGGLYCTGAGSEVIGCTFIGNTGGSGIGARVGGDGSVVSNCIFKDNAPTATGSSTKFGGGLHISSGKCEDCVFEGNAADRGGGAYVASGAVAIRNCRFERNRQIGWASGAALFVNASSPLALVSNCVFNANEANVFSSRTIISNANLVDCVITNHAVASGYVVAGSNMTRCLFAHNSTSSANAQHLDIGTIYGGTPVSRTNVNCVIAYNHSYAAGAITDGKKVVNCTYYGNVCDIGNNANSAIIRDGVAWNTLLGGNTIGGNPMDVRRPYLTNCVFTASAIAVNADGLSGCQLTSNVKFQSSQDGGEFDIGDSSPARNAGVWQDWMAPLLGGVDFAGRPRVKFGSIDAGALECQHRLGFVIEVK